MPDGRVLRIDNDRRIALIVRRGRTYEADLSDVQPAARVPTARVKFNLHRLNGVERAESVELRAGTRTSQRHRRFADLAGAKRAGAKTRTALRDDYGIDVTTQPLRVADAWVDAMGSLDFDGAAKLYAPSARLHTPDGLVDTHKRLRAAVERLPWAGVDPTGVAVHGVDRYVKVENAAHVSYLEIHDGQITEQWVGTEPDLAPPAEQVSPLHVVTRGQVRHRDSDAAMDRVEDTLATAGVAARYGRVKLAMAANDTNSLPASAEVNLDLDGDLVRAHASERTMHEAIDQMAQRLHSQLERRHDRQRHKPTGLPATPGQWRHGNVAPRRDASLPTKPLPEREIVRHKSFAPGEMTVEEAAWDMGLLDYDFFLFVELTTGQDCLLERTDDGRLRLHGFDGGSLGEEFLVEDVEMALTVPPALSVAEAIELHDRGGLKFVFFINRTSNRANVLYERLDGNYGLITPPLADANSGSA